MRKQKNHIAELRRAAGLTQTALAELAQLPFPSMRSIEYGLYDPSVRAAYKIAQALGTTIEAAFFLPEPSQQLLDIAPLNQPTAPDEAQAKALPAGNR